MASKGSLLTPSNDGAGDAESERPPSTEPVPKHPGIQRFENQALEGRRQLVRDGEIIGSSQLAERLGVSRQAVHLAVTARRLFSMDVGPDSFYPAFYADPDLERHTLEQVIRKLGDSSGWSKWQFFTRPKSSLGGLTPLEALKRGQLDLVERAAQAFAER